MPAAGSLDVEVKTIEYLSNIKLSFEVMNAVTAPGKHPVLDWSSAIASGK